MPEGPRGIPRFTSIGPFVVDDEDVTEEDLFTEINKTSTSSIKVEYTEFETLVDEPPLGVGVADSRGIIADVELNYYSEASEFVKKRYDKEIATYTAGSIRYAMSNVGYIHKVYVKKALRRLGIGNELMDIALNDMREENINTVYAKTVSSSGQGIAADNGFEVATEELNSQSRDTWMVKKLSNNA
jgi:N-acetylglutamate synthase-like GNAT family acetyltransferase